jgi:polysaccharide pyruvyl transferase WcaK-like protein
VEKCAKFSVRDEFSADAVSAIRTDVEIVLDPIFVGRTPYLPTRHQGEKTQGVLWIPGKLVPGTADFYSRLYREVYLGKVDAIASFNEVTDRHSGFDDMFAGNVVYLSDIPTYSALLRPRSFAVSERYHGCILALKSRVPCFGVTLRSRTVTSKIAELYRRLGLQKTLITADKPVDRRSLNGAAKRHFDFEAIEHFVNARRSELRAYLRSCLEIARCM